MFQPTRRIRDRVVLAPTSKNDLPPPLIGRLYYPCFIPCIKRCSFVTTIRSFKTKSSAQSHSFSFFFSPRWTSDLLHPNPFYYQNEPLFNFWSGFYSHYHKQNPHIHYYTTTSPTQWAPTSPPHLSRTSRVLSSAPKTDRRTCFSASSGPHLSTPAPWSSAPAPWSIAGRAPTTACGLEEDL